jgi:hypothetical protein
MTASGWQWARTDWYQTNNQRAGLRSETDHRHEHESTQVDDRWLRGILGVPDGQLSIAAS